jgi:SAM-dependent methyltransferase
MDFPSHRTSARTATHWDSYAGTHLNSPTHWEANEAVRRFQWALITGNPELNPVAWFMERHGPFRAMCSLCSGTGILERMVSDHWLRSGGNITGFDISPRSVEDARKAAAGFPGLSYEVRDLDRAVWSGETYDAVFAHGALHHVSRLDFLLGQIREQLVPGGLLYVNDYVGPARFQWSDAQMRLANELLLRVPRRYRAKREVARCDPVTLAETDPSEAVCANFIVESVQAHFEIIWRVDRGGTLLAPIFGSACLDPSIVESAEGLAIIDDLCVREHELIRGTIIPSNHVVLVAKRR